MASSALIIFTIFFIVDIFKINIASSHFGNKWWCLCIMLAYYKLVRNGFNLFSLQEQDTLHF